MSFFSTIDRMRIADPKSRQANTPLKNPSHSNLVTESAPKNPIKIAARAGKPVKLSFLRPCSTCGKSAFVYSKVGGLLCSTCNPGSKGEPVNATEAKVEDIAEGQHLSCNFRPVVAQTTMTYSGKCPPVSASKRLGENPENFKAAWSWLQKNLEALLASGWTRAALFQKGKLRYPGGQWGIAWIDAWRKKGLSVSIGSPGQVIFCFEVYNRKVQQSAYTKRPLGATPTPREATTPANST